MGAFAKNSHLLNIQIMFENRAEIAQFMLLIAEMSSVSSRDSVMNSLCEYRLLLTSPSSFPLSPDRVRKHLSAPLQAPVERTLVYRLQRTGSVGRWAVLERARRSCCIWKKRAENVLSSNFLKESVSSIFCSGFRNCSNKEHFSFEK
ncbi:hypothetical protein CDAR_607941 [Caerostris darwini]|uniref:Uncharacterized protein n=1 Tax=Caerostris darwini TaxID=1538125 RepID=A0AAV4ULI4_9ARAC|nr:hypothetical protein CDAR_607941 [Caerostris darwini]